jgi:hypothetical protein
LSPSILQLVWSLPLLSEPRGLTLAREKGWVLAWDQHRWLYLVNYLGKRQAQTCLAEAATAACCSDDGSAVAAGSQQGDVWLLAPDLTIRWQKKLDVGVLAAALDAFGRYLAVADARGFVHVFDRAGHEVAQLQTARPFHHLAFVPAAPYLVGSSDFGLVGCLDLKGQWLWRDGLVINVGGLSVSGDGGLVALACFTEGVQRYQLGGKGLGRVSAGEPVRLIATSFDGRLMLAAGMAESLILLDGGGRVLGAHRLEQPAVGIALAALGEEAFVATADGKVHAMRVSSPG